MDLISYMKYAVAPFLAGRVQRTQRGASLVEYALLVGLIAIVCIVAVTALGEGANDKFSRVASTIE
jgi:pilus assembly protein Flp/PilA